MTYPKQLFDAARCGAYARTTGHPCQSPAMANGRCRMHGGKSTGRPVIHGRNTKEAKRRRREVREVIRDMQDLLGQS